MLTSNETSKVHKSYSYIGESEIIIPSWFISYSRDAVSGRYISNIESHRLYDIRFQYSGLYRNDIDTIEYPC